MNKFLLKVYQSKVIYDREQSTTRGFFLIFRYKGFSKSSIFQRTKAVFFFFFKKENRHFTNNFEILNAFSSRDEEMTGEATKNSLQYK